MPVKVPPSTKSVLFFASFWAALTGLSFTLNALFWHKIFDAKLILLIIFVIAAAFITALIAYSLEKHFTKNRPIMARFAAIYFLLAIGTAGATYLASLVYALVFVASSFGNNPDSHIIEDYIFFSLVHGYAFVASTARLFLPTGLITLGIGAFFYCIFNRKPH